MFTEDCQSFFNLDEFAVQALMKGIFVNGILESLLSTANQVQCVQFKFTCAQATTPKIKLGDKIKMDDRYYRILEIKPDGTGLLSLLLETVA